MRVHVLPAKRNPRDIYSHNPDGVFFSNGPGDPATADEQVELLQGVLRKGTPFFGICFGNQLRPCAGLRHLQAALRSPLGINQPVMDKTTTAG